MIMEKQSSSPLDGIIYYCYYRCHVEKILLRYPTILPLRLNHIYINEIPSINWNWPQS